MSLLSAFLFSRLQRAGFYRAFHEEAVSTLGCGEGRTWLDVGCGPGLLPELAATAGFRATGVDLDPAMIRAAKKRTGARAAFRTGSFEDLVGEGRSYDVVSASSLLVVLDDPAAALKQLQSLVRPGGRLLILEASERLSFRHAFNNWTALRRAGGGCLLLLWLCVRSGRTLPPSHFHPPQKWSERRLLHGMVSGWTFVASTEPSTTRQNS